jgi:hypothetical protein
MEFTLVDRLIAQAMQKEFDDSFWLYFDSRDKVINFVEQANENRVLPLIYCNLQSAKHLNNEIITELYSRLKKQFLNQIGCSQLLEQQMLSVVNLLNKHDIGYVVLKGFSLSHLIYEYSYLRPFVDIDIFISKSSTDEVKAVLQSIGFYNPNSWEPDSIRGQFTLKKLISERLSCYLDIHFEISNDINLQKVITFDEAYFNRTIHQVKNANINLNSLYLCFIHACFHMIKHEHQGDKVRLVWLYDLFLMLQKFDGTDIKNIKELVVKKEIETVVEHAVKLVSIVFKLDEVREEFMFNRDGKTPDKYEYLLIGQTKGITRFLKQLTLLSSFKAKIHYIFETVFPPKQIIYNKYGKVSNMLLCFYYIKRLIGGIIKWLR